MAQHGYLREYDQGFSGDDRDRDRWRDDDRERGWRGSDRDWGDRDERNRAMMFGGGRNEANRDDDRGFFDRMGEQARSWFRDDEREARGSDRDRWNRENHVSSQYGREHGYGGFQGDYGGSGRQQGGFGGRSDWERSTRNFSSHPDDHYRSWRDKQVEALDRDYADYCREREQQFHQDFDSWRRNRQAQGGQGQQSQQQGASSEQVMELNNPTNLSTEPQRAPSPVADATIGTNNPENSVTGRGRH
jgi:hypothetical protein